MIHDIIKTEAEVQGLRIMAIDLGDVRTGLAISDPLGMICGEAWTIQEWNTERLAEIVCQTAEEKDVSTIVLGLPKNMDGTEGIRAEKSRSFCALLREKTGTPVVMWDERRSTIEAHQILHQNGKREKKHRKTVDAVAASLILESYLGSLT